MSGRLPPLRQPALLAAAAVALWALPCYWFTRAPTVSWAAGATDSGELAAAAAQFGVPHPTGYPLFLVLAHIATWFGGDAAGTVSGMNALLAAGALSVLSVVAAITSVPPGRRWIATGVADVAASAVGVSGLYWSQATVAEVHALQCLLTMAAVTLVLRGHTRAAAFALGLALTNHLLSGVLLLAALARLAMLRPPLPPFRRTVVVCALFLLPLSLYLLLLVRSRSNVDAVWADVSSLHQLWAHMTGQSYRGYAVADLGAVAGDFGALLRFMAGDLPPWLWPLAGYGMVWLWRQRRHDAVFIAVIIAVQIGFTALYQTNDREAYLLPIYLMVGLLAIYGGTAFVIAVGAQRRAGRDVVLCVLIPLIVIGIVASCALFTGLWGVRNGQRLSLRGDDSALRFAVITLEALPPGAVYQTGRDDVTFALWYVQRTYGVRRDVLVLDLRVPGMRGVR